MGRRLGNTSWEAAFFLSFLGSIGRKKTFCKLTFKVCGPYNILILGVQRKKEKYIGPAKSTALKRM
jgi:hypothetical protein